MDAPSDDELVLLGESSFSEAKRLRSQLLDRGIDLRLASNPDACTSRSCSPKLLMYVHRRDVPGVQEFLASEHTRAHDGLEFDPSLIESAVFDPDKESATCPACGFQFP